MANEKNATEVKALTDYGKRELNKKIREYLVKNTEKNELAKECKEIGVEIKDAMGDAGLDTYEVAGIKATCKVVVKRELNKAMIEKLLGRKIPDECYTLKAETRLFVA